MVAFVRERLSEFAALGRRLIGENPKIRKALHEDIHEGRRLLTERAKGPDEIS